MYYEDFATRIFTPLRPHLEEALSCVLGRAPGPDLDAELWALRRSGGEASSGQEAWERLASSGLISFSWVGHSARRFGAAHRESPVSAAQAVALASDARSVATVEALSDEVFLRLQPWGAKTTRGYSWQFVEDGSLVVEPGVFCPWRALKKFLLKTALRGSEQHLLAMQSAITRAPLGWGEGFAMALESALLRTLWESAASSGARVVREGEWGEIQDIPEELSGRFLADLQNPFAPLCAIWEEGYGLLGVEGGRAVLLAPLCAPAADLPERP